jgi:hypothetical protein
MKARLLPVLCAVTLCGCAEARQFDSPPPMVAGHEVKGAAWFERTGCTACHSIAAYNVLNLTAQGPDLSLAVEDVPRRFGLPLDDFLRAPTGTMAMVLATRIPLTPEQRALAVERLKEAYRKHQDDAGLIRPAVNH